MNMMIEFDVLLLHIAISSFPSSKIKFLVIHIPESFRDLVATLFQLHQYPSIYSYLSMLELWTRQHIVQFAQALFILRC